MLRRRLRVLVPVMIVFIVAVAVAWGAQEQNNEQGLMTTYHSDRYGLTFDYPRGWNIRETGSWRNPATQDVWQAQIDAIPPKGVWDAESFAVNVWAPKPKDLKAWIFENMPVRPGDVDLDQAEYRVGGYPAYAFEVGEGNRSSVATLIVIQSEDYVYQISVPLALPHAIQSQAIARSIVIADKNAATFDLESVLPNPPLSTLSEPLAAKATVTSCAGCPNEPDSNRNSYPCCDTKGNCTWKAEQMRSGDDNFKFTGSGRDAYKWMDLEYSTSSQSYAQGGNIPVAGAALIMIKGYCASCQQGHVATVKSIGADGSVTVTEQNCGTSCGQEKTFSTTTLRTYLAGYIYNSSSTPSPTAKDISSTVGTSTIVDDYNFSNVYNFIAKGPGTQESYNGSYRAWYTSDKGYNNWFHATRTSTSSTNSGLWRAKIATTGVYEIQAYIPSSDHATATAAQYKVDGTLSTAINQGTTSGWVKVKNPNRTDGNWSLSSGTRDIELADTKGGTSGKWLAFDALKFIRR